MATQTGAHDVDDGAPGQAGGAGLDALMGQARRVLRDTFGHQEFRPVQGKLIEQVLRGDDVLAVMPTGAGKSLVYQIPALVLPGCAVVISPLISLMRDQVDSLVDSGAPAACITSSQDASVRSQVLAELAAGSYKLLYVAPERLDDQRLLAAIDRVEVSMVAIDEAHCVSQWGQDFRPSYLRIPDFVDHLERTSGRRPRLCALTATATARVRSDIAAGLRLRDPRVTVSSFDRPNLYFGVERPSGTRDKDELLLHMVRKRVDAGQEGIVYCNTRKAVEQVCQLLRDGGVSAARYHAGLSDEERSRAQEDFAFDRASVIVATNAFGMGIDKSNVSFVIHYNMPHDLESYYQEAGRAGRDGEPADCILIYSKRDVQTNQFLIERTYDEAIANGVDPSVAAASRDAGLQRLRDMTIYCTTTDCLRSTILRYFGQTDVPMRCEHCSNCSQDFDVEDATVDAQKVISCVLRLAQRNRSVGKAMIVDILRGAKTERIADNHFDELSTYGIMASQSKQHVRYVLDALVDRGMLAVSGDRYPTVGATPDGMRFLSERQTFELKVPRRMPRVDPTQVHGSRGGVFGSGSSGQGGQGEVDEELFERLRATRNRLAGEAGVPAYIIFSNATLADMARRRPTTEEELLEVNGVGVTKARRYGEAFLACVRGEDPE